MIDSKRSPYVTARTQVGDTTVSGVFLVDTGTASTVVERSFAGRLGVAPTQCQFQGRLEIGGVMEDSGFFVNGGTPKCDREFSNTDPDQNGIIGVDWISDRVMQFDYVAHELTVWTLDDWATCSQTLPPHRTISFVAGPTDVASSDAQPKPSCLFENAAARKKVFSGCSIPYVRMTTSVQGKTAKFPVQVDNGRESGVRGDVSVNKAQLDLFTASGALTNKQCIDKEIPGAGCRIYLYDVPQPATLDIGLGPKPLRTVEYRDASMGEPYKNPAPAGLVGMDAFSNVNVLLFDSLRAELQIFKTGFVCKRACSPPSSPQDVERGHNDKAQRGFP